MIRPDFTEQGASREAFAARLASLVDRHKSIERFAKNIGVSSSALRKWLKGQAEPRRDSLVAVARAARVSVEWLTTGAGPMRRGKPIEEPRRGLAETGPAYRSASDIGDEYVLVPRYRATIAARGNVEVRNDRIVDYLAFNRDWVERRLDADPEHLLLIEAAADWTECGITKRDLLLLDVADPRIRDDALYVFDIDGELVVKRTYTRLDGTLVVSGSAPEIATEEVTPSAVSSLPLVGRVVWVGRRL